MNLRNLARECCIMQDVFNTKVNRNWAIAGYEWNCAAMVELAECVGHLSYKWWKAGEDDLEQAWIEVVDMLHFVLSDMMEETSTNAIADMFVATNTSEVLSPIDYLNTPPGGKMTLLDIKKFCNYFDKTDVQLLQDYVGKNVLNTFRQDHGYKDGSYVKIWADKEDNVYLAKIMKNLDYSQDNLQKIVYDELKLSYELYSGLNP